MIALEDVVVGQEFEVTNPAALGTAGFTLVRHLGNRFRLLEIGGQSAYDSVRVQVTRQSQPGHELATLVGEEEEFPWNWFEDAVRPETVLLPVLSVVPPFADGQRVRVREETIVSGARLQEGTFHYFFVRERYRITRNDDPLDDWFSFPACQLPRLAGVLEPVGAPPVVVPAPAPRVATLGDWIRVVRHTAVFHGQLAVGEVYYVDPAPDADGDWRLRRGRADAPCYLWVCPAEVESLRAAVEVIDAPGTSEVARPDIAPGCRVRVTQNYSMVHVDFEQGQVYGVRVDPDGDGWRLKSPGDHSSWLGWFIPNDHIDRLREFLEVIEAAPPAPPAPAPAIQSGDTVQIRRTARIEGENLVSGQQWTYLRPSQGALVRLPGQVYAYHVLTRLDPRTRTQVSHLFSENALAELLANLEFIARPEDPSKPIGNSKVTRVTPPPPQAPRRRGGPPLPLVVLTVATGETPSPTKPGLAEPAPSLFYSWSDESESWTRNDRGQRGVCFFAGLAYVGRDGPDAERQLGFCYGRDERNLRDGRPDGERPYKAVTCRLDGQGEPRLDTLAVRQCPEFVQATGADSTLLGSLGGYRYRQPIRPLVANQQTVERLRERLEDLTNLDLERLFADLAALYQVVVIRQKNRDEDLFEEPSRRRSRLFKAAAVALTDGEADDYLPI